MPLPLPLWLRDEDFTAHTVPGHPERPERIAGLEAEMEANGWFGWERRQAPEATRAQLEAVHPAEHIDFVASLCRAGGGAIDADTAAVAGTCEAAWREAEIGRS